jgi:hypothetical protein
MPVNNMSGTGAHIFFLIVATLTTTAILFLRFYFKKCVFLWKSTLIVYISFLILTLISIAYENFPFRDGTLSRMLFQCFYIILVIPSWLIYCLIPPKRYPSAFDIFIMTTIGFLFYMIVIWGILKIRKIMKENKAAGIKPIDDTAKQTPPSIDTTQNR